jgi:ribosomal protein L11 methylase PrmA
MEDLKLNRHTSSFRDPSGFLYRQDERLLRQVNTSYKEDYDLLLASGLYERLVGKGWLVHHSEVEDRPAVPGLAYKILQPEQLSFISYPYEWCFSQLKDAALLTLRLQREALEAGMTLKDASAYNIQFQRGKPVLIDTLSFSNYIEGQPWVAYRQFCMHFLAPLALMSYTDIRLNKLSQINIDGIPLDLASKLLPAKTRLNFGLLTHIHLHAYSQQRYSNSRQAAGVRESGKVSKVGMIGLVESLENTVRKLIWKPRGTDWVDYYSGTNYTDDSFEQKKRIVGELIRDLAPHKVWDLGANTGVFSRLGADLDDCLIISSDIDPGAVEVNYQECKKQKVRQVYPLIIDLTNPSPAIGWANEERQSFIQRGPVDLVIALALIHHLAISNNVPLEEVARFMASLGERLIIEFVPKEDSQVQRLLASRVDIFPGYTIQGFIEAFTNYFQMEQQISIPGTARTIFLFGRK